MKYKVGDKVRIRKGLEDGDEYGKWTFSVWASEYLGDVAEIVEVHSSFELYELDIDDGYNIWTDEMLEPVKKTIRDVEVGEYIIDNDDCYVKVLEVMQNGAVLSNADDDSSSDGYYTFDEMEGEFEFEFGEDGTSRLPIPNELGSEKIQKLRAWMRANHMMYKSADDWREALIDYIEKLYEGR